jgi:hypothetical protein
MNWYYESNGLQQGPVSESELRQLITLGRISKHNLLWRNGMHDWTPLGEVEDLSPHPHSAGATALAHTPDAEASAGTADDLQKENSPSPELGERDFGDFEGALNQFTSYKIKKNKTSVELNAELYINYCNESLKLNELAQASFSKTGSIVPTQLGKSYSLNQIELTGKFFNSIEFQTKLDKKKNYEPLIFKSEIASMRFFASYGEKDEENKANFK